jgi:DNA repair protein RecO (recombination protein O)
MNESAQGLILRTRPLTDTSLIVHWLTPELGRIATVAKGARRPKSPFAGKLDLFYEAAFSFQRSRRSELHLLREVQLKETHGAIRRDLERLKQAAYAAALIEQATEMEAPMPEICELMTGFIAQLSGPKATAHGLPAFELKLLAELGLQPHLESEKLRPDLKQIIKALSAGTWSQVSRLKLTQAQLSSLDRFLEGFLVYHLGKVPKGRERMLEVRAV